MSKPAKAAAVPREQEWLNGGERERLQELESVIDAGARAFVQMGQALGEVRDARLYREGHDTFEAYCRAKWGLSRARAYELMAAAGVADALSAIADTPLPRSEAVSRELAPLRDDPDAMATAMSAAVEQHGDSPTAAQVREVVRGPEGDLRCFTIEDAADSLRGLPEFENMAWPTELGDMAAMDKATDFLAAYGPAVKRAWKAHKAELKSAKAHLRSVA